MGIRSGRSISQIAHITSTTAPIVNQRRSTRLCCTSLMAVTSWLRSSRSRTNTSRGVGASGRSGNRSRNPAMIAGLLQPEEGIERLLLAQCRDRHVQRLAVRRGWP